MSDPTPSTDRRPLTALRRRLDTVCTRDYGRLFGRWRKLSRQRPPDATEVRRLDQAIAQSVARRQARTKAKPALALDAGLPISAHAEAIIGLIREHPVIVVAGATGSGKTTQLPRLCLAAGRGEAGLVGCTQPRRLAARSVARRVAEEMDTRVGDKVGFQVRFHEQVGDATLVKFMTDGILLAETQSDPWLSAYDTLIIDEAHERSLNIDFLLGYVKRLLARRRNLKVIITSATIDTARFARHFNDAPVVEVEGRTWPVEVRWRPGDDKELAEGGPEHVARAVDELTADAPRGDVLVFLPGEREIREAHLHLQRRQYRHTEILPLYARLSARDQDRVFHPGPARRIVLATNVAETSLTVPRIHAVVDTGTARVMRYSQRSQIGRLHVEPVSQAAADQRKGRCGRVGPGICIRLYGESDHAARARFTDPELLRSSLADVILRMLSLKLGEVEDFPFLDPPEARAIGDGYRRLAEVQAIDEKRRLTQVGRELARLPIDVQLARVLLEARTQDVLPQVLVIASFLGVQDPRQRPAEAPEQADAAHRAFADPHSDFVGVLKLWQAWSEARDTLTQSRLRDWCQRHFVAYLRMREWREVHRQLVVAMRSEGLRGRGRQGRGADDSMGTGPGTRDRGPGKAQLRGRQSTPHVGSASKGAAHKTNGRVEASTRARPWNTQTANIATTSGPRPPAPGPGKAQLRGGQSTPHVGSASKGAAHKTNRRVEASTGTRPWNTQTANIATTSGPRSPVPGPEYKPIHLALLSGFPTQVGHKDEHGIFRGTRERKFQVFPGSALAKKSPKWVFAAQILDIGGKVWGMQCARVEPAWVERQAAHLLRRSWHDPHWSRKRGAVVAYEQVTLFGMVLVERRRVSFRKQDPERAHRVFLREALARCELDARADFVTANARVLTEAQDVEARQRRQGLIRDDDELADFFAGKLPPDITDVRALDAWYRKAAPAKRAALRWSLADVMRSGGELEAGAFPPALVLDGQRYRLQYRFVPGDDADGVTLRLPIAHLDAVPEEPCQWLVPGLLPEKVAALIRGLPKSMRRNFVPAPDFARAFVETEPSQEQPLAPALAKFLTRTTGVVVEADVFDTVDLPVHLRMRFALHDGDGTFLAAGRALSVLREQWKGQARAAFTRKADANITREEVTSWDFGDIPARIEAAGEPDAFPALVDLGQSVALRVFARNAEARAQHVDGVCRLLRLALEKSFRRARKQLPVTKKTALQHAPLGSVEGLRADIVEGAFADLLTEDDLQVRTARSFDHLRGELEGRLFAAAVERLERVEPIIEAQAGVTPWLRAPRAGQSPASYADLAEQFDTLLAPDLVRTLPASRLRHYPRYLQAMRVRAERLQRDPGKDYRHLQQIRPFWQAYQEHAATGKRSNALERLHWLIEEWRVSLFAQELKTAEPVSAKRVRAALEQLGPPPSYR